MIRKTPEDMFPEGQTEMTTMNGQPHTDKQPTSISVSQCGLIIITFFSVGFMVVGAYAAFGLGGAMFATGLAMLLGVLTVMVNEKA